MSPIFDILYILDLIIVRLLHEALEDNPGARKKAIEDVKKPLKDLTELIANPANNFILFLQKYQSAMTETVSSVDNLKDIFENAMGVVGLTREDVAKVITLREDKSLELVSKELNHFGMIAGLFRQIGGHSSRFVLFCSF